MNARDKNNKSGYTINSIQHVGNSFPCVTFLLRSLYEVLTKCQCAIVMAVKRGMSLVFQNFLLNKNQNTIMSKVELETVSTVLKFHKSYDIVNERGCQKVSKQYLLIDGLTH